MPDVARERTVLAPAGHACVHQPRIAFATRVGADAEPFRDAGPESFEQHVGLLAQLQHDLGAAFVLQVDTDAAAAPVDHRIGRHESRNVRTGCHVGGAVESQHLRAHVGKQHPRELHGPDIGQLDDANACEGPGRGHGSLNTRCAFSRRNFGHTWSRNGTSGISVKSRS